MARDDQHLLEIDVMPLDMGFNYHFFEDMYTAFSIFVDNTSRRPYIS